jgi:hypothetical protein
MFDNLPLATDHTGAVADCHLPQFCRELCLTANDLQPFGPELRVSTRYLQARHRELTGSITGFEIIRGEKLFSLVPGGRKSLFRSPVAAHKARLFLADGPLPALCTAAFEARHADTEYAAPGGPWTRAAADAVVALVKGGIREVVLGFGSGPAGLSSMEQASACLRERTVADVTISVLLPTAGSWMRALRETRRYAAAS